MTTISFKLTDEEARAVRAPARRAHLSLSEYLRRKIRNGDAPESKITRFKSPLTGAEIFSGTPDLPPLTAESVREMMESFP